MLVTVLEVFFCLLRKFLFVFCVKPLQFFATLEPKIEVPRVDSDLLLLPAVELIKKIANKEVSSYDVVDLYIKRIEVVNPLLNATVEQRFEGARSDAKRIDDLIGSSGLEPDALIRMYPLLGLPITVKESIAVAGMSHTAGLKSRQASELGKAAADADVVKTVKERGGVILCVTNTPQLCVNWETNNKITGTTNNPYDIRRTVGGSSGGEAALLSSCGSIIGIGSDFAGSLRIPCHFCGIYGHKPSPGVVSGSGHFPDNSKNPTHYSIGPLSRYACDLTFMFKGILEDKITDDVLKLNEEVDKSKLKLYYVNNWRLSPILSNTDTCVKDAIENLIEEVEMRTSITVTKLGLPEFREMFILSIIDLLLLKDVPAIDTVDGRNPHWEFIKYIFRRSDYIIFAIIHPMLQKAARNYLTENYKASVKNRILTFKNKLESILGDHGVLIMPVFPTTAHFHGQIFGKSTDTAFIMVFNTLGLPVTTCPIGCDKNGLPIAVQVISKTNCDRNSLAMAEIIENTVGWKPAPWKSSHI